MDVWQTRKCPKTTVKSVVHHDARTQYRSNRNEYRVDRSEKTQNATFERIKPNVPGFFRIGIQFERISGRSASFLQKLHFSFLPLLGELSRTSRDSFESESDSKESRDVRLNSFKSGILHFFDSIDTASERRCGPPSWLMLLKNLSEAYRRVLHQQKLVPRAPRAI